MRHEVTAALAGIAAAVEVLAPRELSVHGRRVDLDAELPVSRESLFFHPDPLLSRLQQEIYQTFYACITAGPGQGQERHRRGPSNERLLGPFARANAGRERWDEGWTVFHKLEDGSVIARRDERVRRFPPGQYVYDGLPPMPHDGFEVRVRVHRESRGAHAGFYHSFGEHLPDQQADDGLLRFYWNVARDGAVPLIREVTSRFNRFQVPFRLKCLAAGYSYERLDPAVLYVGKRYVWITLELVREVYPRVADRMRERTPLFTRRLAPGLALAEDPGTGGSFGTDRCLAVAEGLKAAFAAGGGTPGGRLAALLARFAAREISLDAPYLRRADCDPFGLQELELGLG
ncbi:MAG TPA: T3SS effector HopA1 family protein [Thermoanaerobaculia bacterium]|nr:T3SS effector HopA1 family protein [Thermoanaerobaculia bacterium]